MRLSSFDFKVPLNLIAQHPAKRRDDSKLLVIDKQTGAMESRKFRDIIEYFEEKDTFLVNDTKLFPAQIFGKKEKTGAKIEVFLLRELNKELCMWDANVEPARKIRVGNKLYFGTGSDFVAEVIDNTTSRGRTLRFSFNGNEELFRTMLEKFGNISLPKYIKRKIDEKDKERFQTIYAKTEGGILPSMAGLHFTENLIKEMEIEGIIFVPITVHNRLSINREINIEDLSRHKLETEYCQISERTAHIINKTKQEKKRVCAVGLSALRSVENSLNTHNRVIPFDGYLNWFIYPPYKFQVLDSLLTNFHPPRTPLYIMTSVFGGVDLIKEAYKKAIKEKFRFYAYGDAMLIL
ncbi:MAG: tRNA preQ1(34) S-adenosylmethionine ribosyltransferase-isomerase QueA [Chitinophagaceae bacterium]